MRKRPGFAGIFLILIVVIAVVHLFVQLAFFGTGIEGFAEHGISGLAVDGSETMTGNIWSRISSSTSTIILFAEWGLILLGILFVYAKHRVDLKKEYHDLKLLKEKKNFSKGTELDNFYELLKESKHFRLSTAATIFDVDEDIIEDWAKTLESGKLATLTYPRIGGPEILLREKSKEGDEMPDNQKKEANK